MAVYVVPQSMLYDMFFDRINAKLAGFFPRDVGVKAIENLMEKKGKFDYILLETSGLADPGPIASMFWLDDGLGSEIYLDGIVTLVDAKNIRDHMNEKKEDVMINEALK